MSKKPKIALPDPDSEDGQRRINYVNQFGTPFFPSAWKYENEPRVLFKVHVLRSPRFPYGCKSIVGVPESLAGKPKVEKRWIQYELGGSMVKLKNWRAFILPELKHKRLLT